MYRIGDFSKLSKTTIKTLRYYDEIGLLKPEYADQTTNYRFYSTRQLTRLHQIQCFRQIGLSIDEIKLILSGHDPARLLLKRKAELAAELKHGQEQLSRIEFILSGKEKERLMNYHAIVKELPECIVYYKEMVVPNYDAYFDVIPAIGEAVKAANPDIQCATPEYCFIVYLDSEYKEKNIHIEFCEAVDRIGKEVDGIRFKRIPAAVAVSVMHKGPYDGLPKAYAYALEWVQENGYAAADCPREHYIDGIWNKDDSKEWLTEIQVPIQKRER